jgi:hypothetical protein
MLYVIKYVISDRRNKNIICHTTDKLFFEKRPIPAPSFHWSTVGTGSTEDFFLLLWGIRVIRIGIRILQSYKEFVQTFFKKISVLKTDSHSLFVTK